MISMFFYETAKNDIDNKCIDTNFEKSCYAQLIIFCMNNLLTQILLLFSLCPIDICNKYNYDIYYILLVFNIGIGIWL